MLTSFLGDGSLQSLVQAMQSSDILAFRLQRLCQNLLNYVLKPVVNKRCILEATENGIHLKLLKGQQPNNPLEVMENLEQVMYLIAKCFDFEIDHEENFNSVIGREVAEKLMDYLLRNCLFSAVPNKRCDLEDFSGVLNGVKSFETTLVDLKFAETTGPLTRFRENIQTTFVTKRCTSILVQARQLMKMDLHQTIRLDQKKTMSYEEAETTFKTEFNIDVDIGNFFVDFPDFPEFFRPFHEKGLKNRYDAIVTHRYPDRRIHFVR